MDVNNIYFVSKRNSSDACFLLGIWMNFSSREDGAYSEVRPIIRNVLNQFLFIRPHESIRVAQDTPWQRKSINTNKRF